LNKSLAFLVPIYFTVAVAYGQQDTTTIQTHTSIAQDDPAQFLTRVEIINELQHHKNIDYLNITTLRSVIALGKRFTTRFDVPVVYNSNPVGEYDQAGIGDVSIRVLGFKFLEYKKAAMLASVEFSFNTAQSPLLGTGKNIITPVFTYSQRFPKVKTIMAFSFQQFYSLWGDETRSDIRWTKLQVYYIKACSKKIWVLVLPEFYIDHIKGGASMDIEANMYYRFSGRFAIWVKGGVGLFGDHPAVYVTTTETGLRYMMLRKPSRN
jgi:hypothetical protein